jgi:hypothetical protein
MQIADKKMSTILINQRPFLNFVPRGQVALSSVKGNNVFKEEGKKKLKF